MCLKSKTHGCTKLQLLAQAAGVRFGVILKTPANFARLGATLETPTKFARLGVILETPRKSPGRPERRPSHVLLGILAKRVQLSLAKQLLLGRMVWRRCVDRVGRRAGNVPQEQVAPGKQQQL